MLRLAVLGSLAGFGMLTLVASALSAESNADVGVLIAVGDIMYCDDTDEAAEAKETAKLAVERIAAARAEKIPVAITLLGDLAYERGSQEQYGCFKANWLDPVAAALASPDEDVLPVLGNHDAESGGGTWYLDTFKTNRHAGHNPRAYYTLAYPPGVGGAWRIFAMNSNVAAGTHSDQYKWLKHEVDTLSAAQDPSCLLGLWHAPVVSSGHHGHDESPDFAGSKPVVQDKMAAIEALIGTAGGSLILNGHDHDYEELMRHGTDGKATPDGMRSFVVGTGGKALYHAYAKTWPDISAVYDTKSYGVLEMRLKPTSYSWAFYATTDPKTPKYSGSDTCNSRK